MPQISSTFYLSNILSSTTDTTVEISELTRSLLSLEMYEAVLSVNIMIITDEKRHIFMSYSPLLSIKSVFYLNVLGQNL